LGIASLYFYGFRDFKYLLPIILSSVCFNFFAGRILFRRRDRHLLFLFVAFNLLLLGYFKYANFFIGTLAALLPIAPVPTLEIILPIGISFFTFTQIAFLVDTFQGKAQEYKFHHYLLFVTFFPHLIAGPILHHKEMMPQFRDQQTYKLKPPMFMLGLSWFVAGLFKKVVLADAVGVYVAPVFDTASSGAGLSDAWLASASFALQLYFDFSGYSDMAVGLALLFGIRLPLNFNSPYQAVSIADFWRRWHMTLSRFLRDYLYIPLGGNQKGPARRYTNLMITMLLGGLWHGASWNFVAWGGIHGAALSINHFWRDKVGLRIPSAVSRVLTLILVIAAWVPFRAHTVDRTLSIWRSMIGLGRTNSYPAALDGSCIYWVASLSLIALFLPNTQAIFKWEPNTKGLLSKHFTWDSRWPWAAASGIAFGIAIGVIYMGSISEFLYFRF
jgi:D-alanyl-lipoteichoic acid acyltransferase DltB (MBOAT superfamily)